MEPCCSLLDDPVFTLGAPGGEKATLPEILHRLAGSDVPGFGALQPYQQQAWFAFLAQLAALVVARACGGQRPETAEAWRRGLLELAPAEAWSLVTPDASRPAFMQPPVPGGSPAAAGYQADIETPDDLDVLVTSKSHDVKRLRIRRPDPEHWIYALVMLQTMQGFFGQKNYGIARMNGGFGSRPMVGLSPGLSWGERFRRDLEVLLEHRVRLSGRYDLGGPALLWTAPWDGGKHSGLRLDQCDPLFIEVCRRIRFQEEGGRLVCLRANSDAPRIEAPAALNGMTGDPWTPVDKVKAKALTVSGSGFDYRLLDRLLFSGDTEKSAALEARPDERRGAYLIARVLARGQGTTEGLHERIVPIRPSASRLLGGAPSEQEFLAQRSRSRVELAAKVQRDLLYPAVAALVTGGADKKAEAKHIAPWTEGFSRAVDEVFFDALWSSTEMSAEEATLRWEALLWRECLRQFAYAEAGAPIAAMRRWRARSKARSLLYAKAPTVLTHFKSFSSSNSSNL